MTENLFDRFGFGAFTKSLLTTAFDDAWAQVQHLPIAERNISLARQALADAVYRAYADGHRAVDQLVNRAIDEFSDVKNWRGQS